MGEERPNKQRKLSHSSEHNGNTTASEREGNMQALRSDNFVQERPEQSEKVVAASNIDETNDNDQSSGCRLLSESLESSDERNSSPPNGPIPISKNQLKKLRRRDQWEAGRADRKLKRKKKIQEQRARKRAAKAETQVNEIVNGQTEASGKTRKKGTIHRHVQLPIAFIIDCGFDNLMVEKERISLGSQLTRCYSDNHRAPFQGHLLISSWGGLLKDRFDTVLRRHYESWKGTKFVERDFVFAAQKANELMNSQTGGRLEGAFESHSPPTGGEDQGVPGEKVEVVYLTSDSPNTLETLKPYSVYIIGGLVDKNRHKGICYKTACEKGIKTAKLPIGQYMDMQSRFVLATNHVVEIMVRWLECGDWGEAFMQVMPKRKGGKLKEPRSESVKVEDQSQTEAGEDRKEDLERLDSAG